MYQKTSTHINNNKSQHEYQSVKKKFVAYIHKYVNCVFLYLNEISLKTILNLLRKISRKILLDLNRHLSSQLYCNFLQSESEVSAHFLNFNNNGKDVHFQFTQKTFIQFVQF